MNIWSASAEIENEENTNDHVHSPRDRRFRLRSVPNGRGRGDTNRDQIERVTERKVETPYGLQIHHPGKGAEFAKLTFAPRLLPDGTGDPCSFGSSVPLYKAGDYELVDSTDRKVLGMDVSWKGEPCKSFTVLFQSSPVNATFVKIRFNGSEADLSQVPGAKPTDEVKK